MKRLTIMLAAAIAAISAWAQWAQVNVSVANVRTNKGQGQELCTQEYLGMPVKLLSQDGDWWQVETTDGYKGWVNGASLAMKTDADLDQWRKSERYVVTADHQITGRAKPDCDCPRGTVIDLVPNDIVVADASKAENGRIPAVLPDGRQAWVDACCLTPIEAWASQDFNADLILSRAYAIVGTPYLWGGNSVKGLDCSGLSKNSYLANGIFLLRDASMQARTGQELPIGDWSQYQPGDLLFWGNASTGKVTHVGIYDKDGTFIHSSGINDCVQASSFVKDSPIYYKRPVIKACRINGSQGTPGIVRACDHPWLF